MLKIMNQVNPSEGRWWSLKIENNETKKKKVQK